MGSRIENAFGEWLRKELTERGWSYARLAREARGEFSAGAVKTWVTGIRNISERYCDPVADALGVSRNYVRQLANRPLTDDDPIERQAEDPWLYDEDLRDLTPGERNVVRQTARALKDHLVGRDG